MVIIRHIRELWQTVSAFSTEWKEQCLSKGSFQHLVLTGAKLEEEEEVKRGMPMKCYFN